MEAAVIRFHWHWGVSKGGGNCPLPSRRQRQDMIHKKCDGNSHCLSSYKILFPLPGRRRKGKRATLYEPLPWFCIYILVGKTKGSLLTFAGAPLVKNLVIYTYERALASSLTRILLFDGIPYALTNRSQPTQLTQQGTTTNEEEF